MNNIISTTQLFAQMNNKIWSRICRQEWEKINIKIRKQIGNVERKRSMLNIEIFIKVMVQVQESVER